VYEAALPIRILMALAILLNTLDLIATSFGILRFGNAEGNPFLAALMQRSWLAFMLVKGVGVPLLLAFLVAMHRRSPRLVTLGMGLVVLALVVALGMWGMWYSGMLALAGPTPL
jgi:hypothetical protein